MWWWQLIPEIYHKMIRIQLDTQTLLKGQLKMANETKLQEAIDRINGMVSSAVELAALKQAISDETALIQEQIDQFDLAINVPDPLA